MKRIIITLLIIFPLIIYAQKVDYKVVLDDPYKHPQLSVNLEFLNIDMAFRNVEAVSMNSALWGYYEPVYGKIGINYLARKSILSLARLGNKNYPGVFEADLGSYLIFSNSTKTKNTKIILKSSTSTNYKGDRITTTTFIMVPALVKSMNGARGGIYHKSSPLILEANSSFAKDVKIDMEASISSQAVYAGFFTRKIRNIVIDTEQYGTCFNSLGNEIYLDAMFFISNKFQTVENSNSRPPIKGGINISDTVKNNSKQGIFGIRMGYKKYQIAPKSEIGKRFGMSATFEMGYRPYHGIFMNAGIGITIGKRRPKN